MWFWIGLLVGIFAGMVFAVAGQSRIEKNAVENRVVKLDDKFYAITPIIFDEKMVKKEGE